MRKPTITETSPEGGKLLVGALSAELRSVKWLAGEMGLSPKTLYRWIKGVTTPSRSEALFLQDRYQIPIDSWKPKVET